MWCRRTLIAKEKEIAKTAAATQKAAGKKNHVGNTDRKITKKTRVPCLSAVQHVRLQLESTNKIIAFQLHSPTLAIGKGNWATMLRAKKKWSLHSCGEVGEKLNTKDSSGISLQEAADNVRYIGKCVTQDDAA